MSNHETKHHKQAWTKYEDFLNKRSKFAGPLVCLLGLLRFLVLHLSQSNKLLSDKTSSLQWFLFAHRIGLLGLLILSIKWPNLYKIIYYYETMAMIVDFSLPLSGENDVRSGLLFYYMLLVNTIEFVSFYYNFILSVVSISVQVICLVILRNSTKFEEEHLPVWYAILLLVTILVIATHLHWAATRIGLWIVQTTVNMESNTSLLD